MQDYPTAREAALAVHKCSANAACVPSLEHLQIWCSMYSPLLCAFANIRLQQTEVEWLAQGIYRVQYVFPAVSRPGLHAHANGMQSWLSTSSLNIPTQNRLNTQNGLVSCMLFRARTRLLLIDFTLSSKVAVLLKAARLQWKSFKVWSVARLYDQLQHPVSLS